MTVSDPPFLTSLVAGGLAGTAVDISLFPLDTIKTRLQSQQGFWAAGGFRNIYAGIGPAAAGSAPNAALFFCTYDSVKRIAKTQLGVEEGPRLHMAAASCGEVVACTVRVPVEIVKQRRQAVQGSNSLQIVRHTVSSEGLRGLFRGYLTTVIREVPFSLIQFPLWEFTKTLVSQRRHHGGPVRPWESSVCGAFSGGFAAACTTPLDVAKTRIMLAKAGTEEARAGLVGTLQRVVLERGVGGLFAGVIPRVTWITIGGSVFFGVYEQAKCMLS